jgi:hypothetical protein
MEKRAVNLLSPLRFFIKLSIFFPAVKELLL